MLQLKIYNRENSKRISKFPTESFSLQTNYMFFILLIAKICYYIEKIKKIRWIKLFEF